MPNIGGPDMKAHRLHARIINSVALYGAPVWAETLAASRPLCAIKRRAQGTVAVRAIRAYRTISHVVATALADMPPLELLALMYRHMYDKKKQLQRNLRDDESHAGALKRSRHQSRLLLLQRWDRRLATAKYGRRSVKAVQPCLAEWIGRESGTLTFRVTQLLTGHGCFGEYLCRIGKERTTQCHHCGADHDSAQHTLQDCPAWAAERGVVIREVGPELSLPNIVSKMLQSERKLDTFTEFCETVMKEKEEAEEIRQQAEGRERTQRR
ncbi:uncharacterized protein LOC105190415 [Harpegnathos saltator]|uniref:uncharacterized protein LOC105190415 n=1 Tax=Harpegnathos saltator TaxID=610380 RepID=UPI000DBEE9E1|nr:uncharacterized protein LOC105190415 [Harpegnathos saltator]